MGIHLPDPSEVRPGDGVCRVAASSRRQFLARAAVGGAVLAVGSAGVATALVPAAAQEEGEASELAGEDATIAQLASLALAAASGYGIATNDESPLTEPVVEVVRVYTRHHNSQAAALNARLPEDAVVEQPNATLLAELESSLAQNDADAVLGELRTLEQNLAATHFAALGEIGDQQTAAVLATTLPALTQHSVVLGSLAGTAVSDLLIESQTDEGAYPAEAYPATVSEDDGGDTPTSTTATQGGDGAGGSTTTDASTDETTDATTEDTTAEG